MDVPCIFVLFLFNQLMHKYTQQQYLFILNLV